MALRPFRIPETRLLVINELVVQTTLTFRTDEDEELNYRYTENKDLQTLVQTAVVSLVNCGYTHGIAQGPGFILHQLRKKWPIGRRYIFTRHGEPLQSSLHKYFFQLEFVDDAAATTGGLPPVLEITELRGIGLSPSVSSMAGSTIEGLDAVALPPMAAIFGGANQQQHQQQQQQRYSADMARRSGGHRRSGSGHSNRSFQSSYSNRPQSPSPLSHRGFSPDTGRQPAYHRSVQGALLSSSPPQLHTQYAGRSGMDENSRVSTDNATSLRGGRRQAGGGGGADNEILSSQNNTNNIRGAPDERSPAMSTLRTRSVSRSSIGSANGSMQQSIAEEPSANENDDDDDEAAAGDAVARAVEAAASDSAKLHRSGAPSGPSPPINSQLRIGRTSWYRSLHGISPLSRQQKSLSSSDNEFAFGGIAGADSAPVSLQHADPRIAQTALAADPTRGGSALDVSKIPRIAGQPVRRSPVAQEASLSPPTGIGGSSGGSGSDGLAARLKRKILSPINMHRERLQRNSSSLSREMQRAQAAENRAARGDSGAGAAASAKTGGASALNGGSYGEQPHLSASIVADPRGEPAVDSRLFEDDNASMMSTDSAVYRPSMPPPSKIPPPRTQHQSQSNEQEQRQQQQAKNGGSGAFRYRSAADIASIPEAVKNALLRRIRSPLAGRPDKSSARLSVRDRIAAFNTLTVNSRRNSKSQEHYKEQQQQQVTPPVSGSEHSSSARMAAAAGSAKQIPPSSPAIARDLATPSSYGRTRIGTATGFISLASPVSVSGVVRPHSRASSSVVSMNTRPVSPALSQRSNVSMRVQDAINSLERAANAAGSSSVATTPRALNSPAVGSGLSGTKRSAAAASDALDRLSTPTKRPRAPSLVSYADPDPDAGSSSVSPFGMVQRIIRRNTGR
ncbi:hypothetical protein H4217_003671 [Coemansia sp. RSA 1939]|nr:hypothetical protein H4217_003671 [Coemansia sp. RSA 1939]